MTVKEYLARTYRSNEVIGVSRKELERLRELQGINGISRAASRRISELERKIDKEINDYIELLDLIRQQIESVTNADERLLLRKRYLLFETWENIAADMDYSVQWIRKLHKRALLSFARKNGI